MSFRVGDRVRYIGPAWDMEGYGPVKPGDVFEVSGASQLCPYCHIETGVLFVEGGGCHDKYLRLVPPDADFIPPRVRQIFRPRPVKERA